ncbi:MAG: hypothetical protein ACLUHK_05225 [Eubacteriales bacterium]
MDNFGIDGFKFDAADPEYYDDDFVFSDGSERSTQAKIWAKSARNIRLTNCAPGLTRGGFPLSIVFRDKIIPGITTG